jgi:hypothetical protein
MSEQTAARIRAATLTAVVVAGAAGLGVAAWLLWRTKVPAGLQLPRVSLDAPRAEDYGRVPRFLWAGRAGTELLLLAGLSSGWSASPSGSCSTGGTAATA